jgi:hypothetical protein
MNLALSKKYGIVNLRRALGLLFECFTFIVRMIELFSNRNGANSSAAHIRLSIFFNANSIAVPVVQNYVCNQLFAKEKSTNDWNGDFIRIKKMLQ